MEFLSKYIGWIMVAAGILTLTMIQGVFAPKAVVRAYLGEALANAGVTLVVRNWSFLIVTTAAFLIYAALVDPGLRTAAIVVSGAGKLCFVALVFGQGRRYARSQAFVAAILDMLFVAAFALYLLTRVG